MFSARKKQIATVEADLVKSQGRLQALLDARDEHDRAMDAARQELARAGGGEGQQQAYQRLTAAENERNAADRNVAAVKARIDRVNGQLQQLYAEAQATAPKQWLPRFSGVGGLAKCALRGWYGVSLGGALAVLAVVGITLKWSGALDAVLGSGGGTRAVEAGAFDRPVYETKSRVRHALTSEDRPLDEANDPFSHMQSRWSRKDAGRITGGTYEVFAERFEEAHPRMYWAVRESVKSAAPLIYATPERQRLRVLRQATHELPSNLNAAEAVLILGQSDRTLRKDMLRVLITQMRSQSLVAERLPLVLGDTTGDLRFLMFETIEPYIAGPVPGGVAVSLLQGTSGEDRLGMIRLLIRHLEHPIDPLDARLMIQELDASQVGDALAILGFDRVPEPF